jgi:hypothetical protein
VPWSSRPVREASEGSRTGSPPSAKTIHSGTLSQVEAGPAGRPLARSHSSLATLAWLDHGRPVVRANRAANPGSVRPSCSISFPPR